MTQRKSKPKPKFLCYSVSQTLGGRYAVIAEYDHGFEYLSYHSTIEQARAELEALKQARG